MVIISNGFKNFHMVMAGAEANTRKILTMYIAGAYPTNNVIKWLTMPLVKKIFNSPRFIARKDSIDDEVIRSKCLPELLQLLSLKVSNIRYLEGISNYLHVLSFKWYAHLAVKDIREAHALGARIYHYRAGFGHSSAKVAQELGIVTLCDHSIVHPMTLQYMIDNNGQLPTLTDEVNINYFWQSVLDDFQYADAILVNSQFVKDTFISQGWRDEVIHVAYLGVDTPFLQHVTPVVKKRQNKRRINLIFAGFFGKRKGADLLIESLLKLEGIDWHLDIAGSISPYVSRKFDKFLNDGRVDVLGTLSRQELADRMAVSDAFVFPSLAEGSARVIFEAMACGCYVITTPNSGSIVESGVHGELVRTGDVSQLSTAISNAANDIQMTNTVGKNNAKLIQEKYLQKIYGDELSALYRKLVG